MAAFGKGLITIFILGSLVLAACGGDSEDTSGNIDSGGAQGSTSSNDGSSSSSTNTSPAASTSTGEEGAVASVLKSYFEAILKADANKGYELITADSKAKCSKAKFTSDIEGLKGIFATFGQNVVVQKVVNVSVEGNNANGDVEITIDGKPSPSGPLNAGLAKEGGKWLVVDTCS